MSLASSIAKTWRERLLPSVLALFLTSTASADVVSGLVEGGRTSIEQDLCSTQDLTLSPDGRYLAAWSAYAFPGEAFRSPPPDLAILDVPCIMRRGFVQACALATFGELSPARYLAWSPDSKVLMTLGPGVEAKYLTAPGFRREDAARFALESRLGVKTMHLDGFVPRQDLIDTWAKVQRAQEALLRDESVIVADLPIRDGQERPVALFSRRSAFFARLGEDGLGRETTVSGVALDPSARWLHTTHEGFILASGELVRERGGRTVARGDKIVLDPATGDLLAVHDGLDAITEVDPVSGRFIRRPLPRHADEMLLAYARTANARTKAYHFEAPFGESRILLTARGKTASLRCPRKAEQRRAVVIEKIDLGTSGRPLAARWFRSEGARGVVFMALGGPGAEAADRKRAFGLEPFVEQGFDVVLVTQSGNLGDGRSAPDRLAVEGGAALDKDAALIRQALSQKRFGRYRTAIFYGESFGGLLALAVMQSLQPARDFDQYMLAAPWLRPRPPASWADSRGAVHQNVMRQEQWEKATMGIDWAQPSDGFRRWAAMRAANLSCDSRLAIFYSRTDPTFSEQDIPCAANGNITIKALDRGDHTVALAATEPWLKATLERFIVKAPD
jgi:hypothetical protein